MAEKGRKDITKDTAERVKKEAIRATTEKDQKEATRATTEKDQKDAIRTKAEKDQKEATPAMAGKGQKEAIPATAGKDQQRMAKKTRNARRMGAKAERGTEKEARTAMVATPPPTTTGNSHGRAQSADSRTTGREGRTATGVECTGKWRRTGQSERRIRRMFKRMYGTNRQALW